MGLGVRVREGIPVVVDCPLGFVLFEDLEFGVPRGCCWLDTWSNRGSGSSFRFDEGWGLHTDGSSVGQEGKLNLVLR